VTEFVGALHEIGLVRVDSKLYLAEILLPKLDVNKYVVGVLLQPVLYPHNLKLRRLAVTDPLQLLIQPIYLFLF